MAIDFPTSPSPGQQVTSGSRTWTWSGTYWANNTITGVQGTQGIQGTQGTQGVQGIQGLLGTQGSQGLQGIQGIQGITGAQGITGIQGTQGTQGLQGIMGAQGAQGTQGTQGAQGIQGTQGTQGLQGIQGISGASILGTANTWTNTNAFTSLSSTGGANFATSSGSVGIGTASPSALFHVVGASFKYEDTSNISNLRIGPMANNYPYLRFDSYISDNTGYFWGFGQKTAAGATRVNAFFADNNRGWYSADQLTVVTFTTNEYNSSNPTYSEPIKLRASGVTYFNGGNVGIGTTSPAEKLDVAGNIKIGKSGDSSVGGGYQSVSSFTKKYYGSYWNSVVGPTEAQVGAIYGITTASNVNPSPVTRLTLQAAAAGGAMTDVLSVLGSGNVGIGTTNPLDKLEINGSDRAIALTVGGGAGNEYGGRWRVYDTGTGVYTSFDTKNAGSWTNNRFTILSSNGNVGIGTTSPLAKLNVIGDIKIGDGSNSRGLNLLQNYMSLGETENGATTILGNNIKATDGVNSTVQVSASANDGSVWVALNYSNGITFNRIAAAAIGTQYSENAGELMRITTAGNVGIGTTSPTGKLDILDTGSLNQLKVYSNNATPSVRTYSTSDGFGLLLNSYYSADGAGSFNRYSDIVASTGDTSSSAIRFFTKPPSGNPSERMRIESSGNLVYGSYHNSIEYSISLSIAATQWIKLCGINNPGQVVIKGHCGSNNSEESWEINVRETFTTTKTVISCQRQSYNPHIQEVRVEGSDGGERTIYIKIRAADYAPTCSWRILDCRGTPVIYNTNTTPVGAVYAAITVSGEKVYSTNEDITTAGALSKGSGSFRIEHPLPSKSETHELVHSFIEGPQADLIYRGKATLVNGIASVNIDTSATMTEGTFEALCREVQCFTTNESGWTAIRGKVTGNILTIQAQDSTCTDEISWMVIGERQDKHMIDTEWTDENGKVIVEPLKTIKETAETRDV